METKISITPYLIEEIVKAYNKVNSEKISVDDIDNLTLDNAAIKINDNYITWDIIKLH